MNSKIKYLLFIFMCFTTIAESENLPQESVFWDCSDYIRENTKTPIIQDGITVEWIDSRYPLDLRNSSLFKSLKVDEEKIFSRLTPNHWVVATCEILKSKGARGLNREWKGDVLRNIHANIFIPKTFATGKEENLLELLLHRAISVAIYNVLKREIEKYSPEKSNTVKLKWINDIIINGKKICGIKPDDFVENKEVISYQFAVNINMEAKELQKIDQPATSLAEECHRDFDHNQILREIIVELIKVLQQYKNDLDSLDKLFSNKMAFLGDEVIVYDAYPGTNVEGILENIEKGRIFIRLSSGELSVINPGYGILRKKSPQPLVEQSKIQSFFNKIKYRFFSE